MVSARIVKTVVRAFRGAVVRTLLGAPGWLTVCWNRWQGDEVLVIRLSLFIRGRSP